MRIHGALVVLAALGLVACGESNVGPETAPPPPPPPPTLPPPATLSAALNISQVIPDLVLGDCSLPDGSTADGSLLFLVPFGDALTAVCNQTIPVSAADGHQMTWGEWNVAGGSVTITCRQTGTEFAFSFQGLIPNGVYTVWQKAVTGEGALASQGGTVNNTFTAAADGSVDFTTLSTAGAMTFGGSVGSCQLPVPTLADPGGVNGEFLVILYHTDNQSYGAFPGPEDAGVAHLYFMRQ